MPKKKKVKRKARHKRKTIISLFSTNWLSKAVLPALVIVFVLGAVTYITTRPSVSQMVAADVIVATVALENVTEVKVDLLEVTEDYEEQKVEVQDRLEDMINIIDADIIARCLELQRTTGELDTFCQKYLESKIK